MSGNPSTAEDPKTSDIVEQAISNATSQTKSIFDDMVHKLTKYVNGEVEASAEDYLLLEKLNIATAARYEDMGSKAEMLVQLLKDIQEKQKVLEPYFEDINAIHATMVRTEESVRRLDSLTIEMERQIKALYQ